MVKASNPSPPHSSKGTPQRHVDSKTIDGNKKHIGVKNNLGATAIGGYQRANDRKAKGR